MNMIPVNSSNLSAVGYDGSTLRIQFHSGGLYDYSGVPESVYIGLMNAASSHSLLSFTLHLWYNLQKLR